MMTPRSRKPVVAVSASNICHLANLTWGLKESSRSNEQSYESEGDSLSGAFRDYLSSRSVLTASPVDLSFSSRTGDFDPSSEARLEDLDSSSQDEKIPGSPLSESLLYVLDGNLPENLSSNSSSGFGDSRPRKRDIETDDVKSNKRFEPCTISYSISGLGTESSREIHETSL